MKKRSISDAFTDKEWQAMKDAMEQAFKNADKAFDAADKIFDKVPVAEVNISTIKFSGKRRKTFFKLIKCAFQILFTGKTEIEFKKK